MANSCNSDAEREQRDKRFEVASDTRKFEIELFWKRSLFFWGFIAAAFVAIATLKSEQPTLSLFISAFGLVCSLAWTLANRGSKYWQEQWESKIEEVEGYITGPLFSRQEAPQNKGWWLRGRRYSVSKLATTVSDFVTFVWAAIFSWQVWIGLKCPPQGGLNVKGIFAVALFVIAYCVSVLFFGRSFPKRKH